MDHPNVFFYDEDSEEMYVGGKDYVSKLNVDDYKTIEVCAKGSSSSPSLSGRGCACVCVCVSS